MRFRTRAFLLCFVPFALLLSFSFWLIDRQVQSTVSASIRASLGDSQRAFSRVRSLHNLQNSRFLRVAGENSALKAGMQLLLSDPHFEAARQTVEDQLRELCEQMGFDLLLVSAPDGRQLAGVRRDNGRLAPLNLKGEQLARTRLIAMGDRFVEVASVPIDIGAESIGVLQVGQFLELADFTVPTVLLRKGKVLATNFNGASSAEIGKALAGCGERECDTRIGGENYISLPMHDVAEGSGLILRSLENVDRAVAPTISVLRTVFVSVAAAAVLLAFICSVASARTIVRPLAGLVSELRSAARTGVLPRFETSDSGIREITDLAVTFNHAAVAVEEARNGLQRAYVEFTGSLAHALDARDRYTAGHSLRVSQLSCATGAVMGLAYEDTERIRIGALLHDIGKIGVADEVLQKPGRLTEEEFELVKQHPGIGRRILEGVQGFAPYLAAVELHHENWDGTGYPNGQRGRQTPVDARIIHVADAYDAMTTDRPYRRGMSHEKALQILQDCAGTQFDPEVVAAFRDLPKWEAIAIGGRAESLIAI